MRLEIDNLRRHFKVDAGIYARTVDGISFGVEAGRTMPRNDSAHHQNRV